MKKFKMMLTVVILVSAVVVLADDNRDKGDRSDKKGDYRKDDHRDNDRDEKKSNPWNFFQKKNDRDDHRDYDRRDDRNNAVTFSINLFGSSSGHWETKIIGHNTVLKEIYHPAEIVKYFDWKTGRYIEYKRTPEWTEKVWVNEPVYGSVWVRD